MKYGYDGQKPQLVRRLNRVAGQVGGITKMVENDTYCIDILTQISAAQSALDKVALELVRDHANHCLNDDMIKTDNDQLSKPDELVDAIERLMRR